MSELTHPSDMVRRYNEAREVRLVRMGAKPAPVVAVRMVDNPDHAKRIAELEAIVEEQTMVIRRQRELIKEFADENEVPIPRINDILIVTAEHFKLTKATLTGDQKSRNITGPRHIAYHIARKLGYSTPKIGWAIGGRDHSSIIHGTDRVAKRLEKGDAVLAGHIDAIESRLQAYVSARVELSKAMLK